MFFGRPRDEQVTEMQVLHKRKIGNLPPAVETVESTINNEHNANEQTGEFVKIGTQDRFGRHASV